MKLLLSLVAAALLLVATASTSAQSPSEDALAMLDAALEQPMSNLEIAVIVQGGASSPRVRARIAAAATDALEALNTVGSRPCYADWWMVSRTAWWLVLRSTEALEAADVARELLDNAARDAAMEEFGHTVAGIDLLRYSRDLREQVVCGIIFTAAPPTAKPTPTKTATPIQTKAPPTAKPTPTKTQTPTATP